MRIVIPGAPVPTARIGITTRGRFGRAYDKQSKEKAIAKQQLSIDFGKLLISQQEIEDLHKYPLRISLRYEMPIPKSDSQAVRNQKLWGVIRPDVKPDCDNLTKWTFDLANSILWRDDAQIVEYGGLEQVYSENPCTILTVEAIKMRLNDDGDKFTRIFSPASQEKLESDLAILCMALESLRLCQGEDRATHIEVAAGALKEFANDYGLALKKMISKG